MSECTHDCSSCSQNCGERQEPQSFLEKPHAKSNIKKVVAIVSGKGGVGKSLVTSMMAVNMQRRGKNVGILDADITGPSIPKAFGIHGMATATDEGLLPTKSRTGIGMMSVNLLLPDETSPVVWRGPVIAGAVKQFWTDVIWEDIDFMFVDMPPGTGDVPLTVFQSLPVDAIIVVTSPQELVSMIVEKAVKMADLMDIPVLGIVENLSYFECPDCGKKHSIYGESHIEEIAERYGIPHIAKLPIDPAIAKACDMGDIENYKGEWLDDMADVLKEL